jgi:hypothetical protein
MLDWMAARYTPCLGRNMCGDLRTYVRLTIEGDGQRLVSRVHLVLVLLLNPNPPCVTVLVEDVVYCFYSLVNFRSQYCNSSEPPVEEARGRRQERRLPLT